MKGLRLTWWAGLLSVVAGSVVLLAWGSAWERSSPRAMCDFETVYYHARILVEHGDPYVERVETYRQLNQEGYLHPWSVAVYGLPNIPNVYPPSAIAVVAPLTLFHWGPAHLIWMGSMWICLVIAALLMWFVASDHAPFVSGVLIGFLLANSETLLFEGNSAGIVIGLCVVGAWCFIRQKFELIGCVCLALSLALKPHDSAFVWAYFFLAGGIYRKRALQTLIPTAILVLAAVAFAYQVSPHWQKEMAANISSISAAGGVNDPGPGSHTNLIVNAAINVQTIFAVIRDEPTFYNLASFLLCGGLLLIWVIATVRMPVSVARTWVALAFISSISMLPVYHRHHDAKLLLLAIPGCAILLGKDRVIGIAGTLITTLAIVVNADVPRAFLTNFETNVAFSTATIYGKLMMIVLARPAPLALLAMSVFYLWAYWRMGIEAKVASRRVDLRSILAT